VVALLARIDVRVAAHRHRLLRARAAGRRAGPAAGHRGAVRRAAVEARGVAVVARLVAFDHAVAADDRRRARLSGSRTDEVRLDLAGAGAAVAGDRVAVVALLGRLDDAVAAVDQLHARRADRRAQVAGVDRAVRAAVAVDGVAVVALLAALEDAVAAR